MRLDAPLGRILLVLVLAAFGVVAAIAAIAPAAEAERLVAKTALPEALAIHEQSALLPVPASYVREERYQAGDTLAGLLGRLAVGEADGRAILRLREMRLLRPGTAVTAEVRAGGGRDGELVSLAFLAPRDMLVRIERIGEKLVAEERRAQLATRAELRSSVIQSSLFAATDAAGIPDSIAIQLADVFASDIDFHRELRKGDRFSVLYEMHSVEGRPLRAGRVLAAEFANQGRTYRAIWYSTGFFAPDGRNMRKAFLRSPLELSRVSSGFGMRRHPFLQSWRAHQGVDYAAPTGTRVRAVSDGVVVFAGRQGGYGNLVILRHDSSRETYYAHLSAFGRGIRAGARVSQGDTVGSVGQTGWATGPHLHYEFRLSGTARNPLTIALPPAAPIAAQELDRFKAHAAPLAAQLDMAGQRRLALGAAETAFE
jgi:murein DD-endopeptidase MepM/ murein hydrolase activator NlpD